jgi:hypothetical protein
MMSRRTYVFAAAVFVAFFAVFLRGTIRPSGRASQATKPAAAPNMSRKLAQIESNGHRALARPVTTVMTEDEINAYLASGEVKLPTGVKSARLSGQAGVIRATMSVDFDQITASRRSSNPLLGIFSGVHNVDASAHGSGTHGQGLVNIDTVSLDGFEIPPMALELFVDRYIKPKYPNLGLENHFALPDKIDTATVGDHELTVVQK